MVEHHLAKVRVAGSNPVVRSEGLSGPDSGGVAERRGNGLQSRLHGFKSRLHLPGTITVLLASSSTEQLKRPKIYRTVDWRRG